MLKSQPIQLSSAVTESQASIKKPRLAGIDTMKFYAILAVVIIHVPILPDAGALPYLPEYTAIIEMLCWFSVPFFFVTTGYFLRRSLKPSQSVEKLIFSRCRRLAFIFLFWSGVFALIPPTDWNTQLRTLGLIGMMKARLAQCFLEVQTSPQVLILRGTGTHLWFISALIFSMLIVLALVKLRLEKLIVPLGALLYWWSVLGGAYRNTPIEVSTLGIGYLSPLASTLFVGVGWLFGARSACICSARTAYKIFALGILLHFTEAYIVWSIWKTDFAQAFYLMSPLFGIGAFLVAWSQSNLGARTPLPKIGLYTLGIYAIHPLLIGPCHGVLKRMSEPLSNNLNFALVFAISFLVAYLMSRSKQLRIFVS